MQEKNKFYLEGMKK